MRTLSRWIITLLLASSIAGSLASAHSHTDQARPGPSVGLELVGQYNNGAVGAAVEVDRNIAYLAADSGGLHLVDVGNPAAPIQFSRTTDPRLTNTRDVVRVGTTLYLAEGNEGVVVVDASTPSVLNVIKVVQLPSFARSIALSGGQVYVGEEGGLSAVSAAGANSALSGRVEVSYDGPDVAVEGGTAFVTTFSNDSLALLDVRNPSRPAGIRGTPVTKPTSVRVRDGIAYVGTVTGLQLINVTSVLNPVNLGSVNVGDEVNDLDFCSGSLAVIATNGSVKVVNISNTAQPVVLASLDTAGRARGVRCQGDLVFAAVDTAGMQILRLRQDLLPTSTTIQATGGVLATYDNSLSVTFPNGSVNEATRIADTGQTAPTQGLGAGRRAVQSFTLTAAAVDDGAPVTQFGANYTLRIDYTDAELAALNLTESTLQVIFWNGTAWVNVPTQRDATSNRVTATANHFTEFALVGTGPNRVYLPFVRR